MPTIYQVFTAIFLSVVLFSYCRGSFRRYLLAKTAFLMASWWH